LAGIHRAKDSSLKTGSDFEGIEIGFPTMAWDLLNSRK